MSESLIERRIASLEKRTQRLRQICIFQLSITVAGIVSVAFTYRVTYRVEAQTSPALLRARALVIEDDLAKRQDVQV